MGFTTDADMMGGGIKAASQFASGGTRANLDRANEVIAADQAASELQAGAYNTRLARMKGQMVTGQQVASIGANNLTQGGTNASVVASTAAANEANALTIQNNAMRKAWGFEVQGSNDAFQADLAKNQGMLSGVGTLIGTAGTAYNDMS